MDLSKMGSADIKSNLLSYLDCFSRDAREIFEHFTFAEFIAQLQDANLLYKVVQKVGQTDLSPEAISNHDMGLVFDELIRRFASWISVEFKLYMIKEFQRLKETERQTLGWDTKTVQSL